MLSLHLLGVGEGALCDLVGMAGHLHVAPGALDPPVLADEEGRPDGAHRLLSVRDLGSPGSDLLHQDVVRVAQQLDLQLLLVDELEL